MNILLIFLFCVSLSWSDDRKSLAGFDVNTDLISEKYEAGAYLIYDCEDKHWVCVLEEFYKGCQEQRTKDLKNQSLYHSCVPIGEFPTKKSCFQRQLFLTTHNQGKRFCIKDEWKDKNIIEKN